MIMYIITVGINTIKIRIKSENNTVFIPIRWGLHIGKNWGI